MTTKVLHIRDDTIIVHLLDDNDWAICKDDSWQHGVYVPLWESTENRCHKCEKLITPELLIGLRVKFSNQTLISENENHGNMGEGQGTLA